MLTRKDCQKALKKWQSSKKNLNEVLRLFPSNNVFVITREDIQWIKKNNQADYFHIFVGVHERKAVLIYSPIDASGADVKLQEYPFSYLTELDRELRFVEKEVTTLTKIAILSKDLKVISKINKEKLPLPSHDIECQDLILKEIEDWRNNAADWFFKQVSESKGAGIFNMFTVPIEDIGAGECDVIALFAFKYSKVYNQFLPTIIFVQDESELFENSNFLSVQSNVFNWSQPCPPFCRDKDKLTIQED